MLGHGKLVLASGSPRRVALLEQIGVSPDYIRPADVDETPLHNERPRTYVLRVAETKAHVARRRLEAQRTLIGSYILAADTVVAVGRQILGKPLNSQDARSGLLRLSGRAHRVYSAVCLLTPTGGKRLRLSETRVRFKRLSPQELDSYVASNEWQGKAGGYGIHGIAAGFVVSLTGSYTGAVGLPLFETLALLTGEGFPVCNAWTLELE